MDRSWPLNLLLGSLQVKVWRIPVPDLVPLTVSGEPAVEKQVWRNSHMVSQQAERIPYSLNVSLQVQKLAAVAVAIGMTMIFYEKFLVCVK